ASPQPLRPHGRRRLRRHRRHARRRRGHRPHRPGRGHAARLRHRRRPLPGLRAGDAGGVSEANTVTAVTEDSRTVSRLGTARALVLLAAVLAFVASALGRPVVLVFAPAVLGRSGLPGTAILAAAACTLVVLVSGIAASL